MFNFLNKNSFDKEDANDAEVQAVKSEMEETQNRLFVFMEKLEQRMHEFAGASIPELAQMYSDDSDDKQGYYRMQAAVKGQLESIYKKARDVHQEKVNDFEYVNDKQFRDLFYKFREKCYDRFSTLEALYYSYQDAIDATVSEDYEAVYQKILDEYNEIKDKFTCIQCGSPVVIDQLYFTTTYITCPSCQTQNTFEPSTQAKQLEQLGRSLAEQRTAHLLDGYNEACARAQEIHFQKHTLESSLYLETDKKIIAEKTAQIGALKEQRKALENNPEACYQTYLRAMFDEWNAINPALQEEHEKFYLRLLTDNQKNNVYE